MSIIIKVCGLREPENIHAIEQLGVDMIGFVFSKDNPRYVDMIPSRAGIIPDYSMLQSPGQSAPVGDVPQRVGVFVDEMPQTIVTRVVNEQLDYVQLNGNELPVMIDNLRRTLDPDIHPGIRVIKTLVVNGPDDIARYKDFEGHADLFLFDVECPQGDESCVHHDWSVLDAYDGNTPFLLGGGISAEDARRLLAFHHPQFVGIDLDACFETAPGQKDVEKLKSFVNQFKSANELNN